MLKELIADIESLVNETVAVNEEKVILESDFDSIKNYDEIIAVKVFEDMGYNVIYKGFGFVLTKKPVEKKHDSNDFSKGMELVSKETGMVFEVINFSRFLMSVTIKSKSGAGTWTESAVSLSNQINKKEMDVIKCL